MMKKIHTEFTISMLAPLLSKSSVTFSELLVSFAAKCNELSFF